MFVGDTEVSDDNSDEEESDEEAELLDDCPATEFPNGWFTNYGKRILLTYLELLVCL